MRRARTGLLIGDVIVLILVTVFGFATHGTLGSAGTRMLTTFVPVLLAWALIAPALGVYDVRRAADWRQLWRPFWAMVFAAPMAALLRGFWLNSPILPVFVVVLGGISSLAILAWRLLFAVWLARRSWLYG